MEEYGISDAAAELEWISAIILGLSNQLDNQQCDTLTPGAMDNALHGVVWHIERVVKDLREIDERK